MIMLTPFQNTWLYQHGGRTIDDVLEDAQGRPYVLMSGAEGEDKIVYIPKSYFEEQL